MTRFSDCLYLKSNKHCSTKIDEEERVISVTNEQVDFAKYYLQLDHVLNYRLIITSNDHYYNF